MRIRLVVSAITAGLVLASCSTDDGAAEKKVSEDNAATVRAEAERRQEIASNLAALPDRPDGRIDLAGSTARTLTTAAANAYNGSGTTNRIEISTKGTAESFASLCAGQADLVDSSRQISADELEACRDNGLDVVQVQVAADAIVLAAKAESDVGGDCVDLDAVRTIFRAGSPVTSWRQLEFADVPLSVSGPTAKEGGFELFGQLVLGRNAPVLSDLRSDYRSKDTPFETLVDVVGSDEDNDQAEYLASRKQGVRALRREASAARTTLRTAEAEVTAAEADRQKGIADGRSAAQQAKDQDRQDAAYPVRDKALEEYNALRSQLKKDQADLKKSSDSQRRLDQRRGRVGVFDFRYYELEKELLRPFEMTRNGVKDCIFPSRRTVADGSYPLSRPFLVTTTTRSMERAEVKDFMALYLGQTERRALKASLVPPTADVIAAQRSWFTGEAKPVLVSLDDGTEQDDSTPGPAR